MRLQQIHSVVFGVAFLASACQIRCQEESIQGTQGISLVEQQKFAAIELIRSTRQFTPEARSHVNPTNGEMWNAFRTPEGCDSTYECLILECSFPSLSKKVVWEFLFKKGDAKVLGYSPISGDDGSVFVLAPRHEELTRTPDILSPTSIPSKRTRQYVMISALFPTVTH